MEVRRGAGDLASGRCSRSWPRWSGGSGVGCGWREQALTMPLNAGRAAAGRLPGRRHRPWPWCVTACWTTLSWSAPSWASAAASSWPSSAGRDRPGAARRGTFAAAATPRRRIWTRIPPAVVRTRRRTTPLCAPHAEAGSLTVTNSRRDEAPDHRIGAADICADCTSDGMQIAGSGLLRP